MTPSVKGWRATSNESPMLTYGDFSFAVRIHNIVVRDDNHLEVYAAQPATFSVDGYLGAIGDGIMAPYWVNNSRPLP